jgi:hypothetical protein
MPGQKLYLDQCMVSNLATQDVPWHETRGGKALLAAMARGAVEVWASPMHVLEAFLCADFDENQQVTDTPKLDRRHLADAKRMSCSYEFILVKHFMRMLEIEAPGSIRSWEFFERLRKENQHIYLGLLGLLAAYRKYDRPDAVSDVLRNKITSQLLHSRFARDPRDFVDSVIDAARNYRVTRDDIFEEFDKRPLSELTDEIAQNTAAAVKLDNQTLQKLQREKDTIARSYGAAELGECLFTVFGDGLYLLLTFDVVHIKNQWAQILGRHGVAPPDWLAEASEEDCTHDISLIGRTKEMIFKAVASEQLLLPRLLYKLVLGELEIAFRAGEIPSGGLGFDSEHAALLSQVEAFATVDARFTNLAHRIAGELAENGHHVQVLGNTDELIRYLEGL